MPYLNARIRPSLIMNASTDYHPQTDRLGLLHRGVTFLLISLLTLCLTIFVAAPEPKFCSLLAALCIFAGGRRLFTDRIWPLLAIIAYDLFLTLIIPGPRPELGLVFQHPLFQADCVLLAALALGGQSVRRQHILMLGVLAISLFGVVGDLTGHDMISLIPLPNPDSDAFYQVTLFSNDLTRVRAFFAESGVLGSVTLGFTTIMALGALVLICLRDRIGLSWFVLIAASAMGGAIFCLALTKSGFCMVAAGLLGFIAILFCARDPRCRGVAVAALACLVLGGGAFIAVGPPALTTYLGDEVTFFAHPNEFSAADAADHNGQITRKRCWLLALTSIRQFPLGVGKYGLEPTIEAIGESSLTNELRLMFSQDVFGLKNALANLIAECGVVGLGLLLFWLWIAFFRPIRHYLAYRSGRGALIAALYGASAVSCIVFLFCCELYPVWAFLAVLKFHADAVAQACDREQPDVESIELIG